MENVSQLDVARVCEGADRGSSAGWRKKCKKSRRGLSTVPASEVPHCRSSMLSCDREPGRVFAARLPASRGPPLIIHHEAGRQPCHVAYGPLHSDTLSTRQRGPMRRTRHPHTATPCGCSLAAGAQSRMQPYLTPSPRLRRAGGGPTERNQPSVIIPPHQKAAHLLKDDAIP